MQAMNNLQFVGSAVIGIVGMGQISKLAMKGIINFTNWRYGKEVINEDTSARLQTIAALIGGWYGLLLCAVNYSNHLKAEKIIGQQKYELAELNIKLNESKDSNKKIFEFFRGIFSTAVHK